ncbi:MAG TPA: HU family DNA-binding protein [bacterium]|nr:HU family DNA-binding protein [bacterium]HPS29750.1 HU family DNA-binding protein [bacterium]
MVKKKVTLVATTKTNFIKTLKENVEVSLTNDQAKEIYNVFTAILKDTITAEKKINLNGVGTFKVNNRKARNGINPKTRAVIKIKASKTVGFKPAPSFKKEL